MSFPDENAKRKFGLVLQGGAGLGAYEAGAIEYLYENDMECAIVAGASSGAVNAVALAGAKGYPPDVLKELWGKFSVDPKIPFLPPRIRQSWALFGLPHMYTWRRDYWNILNWTHMVDNSPARRTLKELLDWDQVRDPGHIRVFVSASGVENGETAYFSNLDPDRPLAVEHVLASGSFPGVFPWTVIRNRAYWDGGLTDNTPLKPIIENLRGNEPETMPIFMIDVHSSSAPRPASMQEVMHRMFEILLHNNLQSDSQTAKRYTRFISVLKQVDEQLPADAPVRQEKDWDAVMNYALIRQMRMVEIKKLPGETGADFSRETILRRIGTGYDQMRSSLEETPLEI